MRQRHIITTLCMCFMCFCATVTLGGCAATFASQKPTATPAPLHITAVWIVLTAAFPSDHVSPFEETIRNPEQAQRVYNTLKALSTYSGAEPSCPIDVGAMLHLSFYDGARQVAAALVKPDGCEGARFLDGSQRWLATDERFWTNFAKALGVPRSRLYARLYPSGPSAPVDVPTPPTMSQP